MHLNSGIPNRAFQPDRFVYTFWLRGREVTVAERSLTPELTRLAHLVLDD